MTPNIVKGSNSLPGDRYDDPNHPRNKAEFQPKGLGSSTSDDNSNTNTGTNQTEPSKPNMPGAPDGDHTAKGFDDGANSATNVVDLTDGIHEGAHQATAAGTKETGHGTSIFSKDGVIGSLFKGDGGIGQAGNKVGGPFSSSGAVGKEFEADGKVGGVAQQLAKKNEEH